MAAALTFRARQRLAHERQFEAVYAAKASRARGPVVVHAAPNGLEYTRLGLSVGQRLGGAVARNRVKRVVREAFRLDQRAWPAGLDIVVSVRGGKGVGKEGPELVPLRGVLLELVQAPARDWEKRGDGHVKDARDHGGDA